MVVTRNNSTVETDEVQTSVQRIDVCTSATALLLICYAPPEWYARTGCWLLMAIALLIPRLRHDFRTWLATALILGASTAYNWTTADNHKYLMTYWAVALFCMCRSSSESRTSILAANGRWLTGLVMLLGAGWKLLSPVYRSGSFFEFTFLTDERFSNFVSLCTDLTREQIRENSARLEVLATGYADNINPQSQELISSTSVEWLALMSTWWTVGIELACAALFLLPLRFFPPQLKHFALILFAATTYLIAPVPGFGCLLMIMGMAQCTAKQNKTFLIYLGLYMFVLVGPFLIPNVFSLVAT